jgi:hypothetical protein
MTEENWEAEEEEYPTPKLDAMLRRPEVWVMPEPVQSVLDELNLIINPVKENEGDWERLHGMEDEAFAHAVTVMIEHPEYRDRILHKMKIVVDLNIPRW